MNKHIIALALAGVLASGPAYAATLASATFDVSAEGWAAGEFTQVQASVPVGYDPVLKLISSADVAGNAAFLASSIFLGDKSGAIGGTLSFDLATASFDAAPYSAVALIGGGLTLYSLYTYSPATTLTPYSFSLVGSTFKTSNPFDAAGMIATDAQLMQVLGSLEQLAILVDWQTGGDFTQLDNVVLADSRGTGAVPEPASWALMLVGFGAIGGAMRGRSKVAVSFR